MQLLETDLLRPFVDRANWPGFDIYTEQLITLAPGETRRPDIVMDNEHSLIVFQGGVLDERHIEQARELSGLVDGIYLVIPKRMRFSSLYKARVDECKRWGIGIYWSDGDEYRMLEPSPTRESDPQKIRAQLRHREEELEAGRPGGGTNDETDFFNGIAAALHRGERIKMARAGESAPAPKGWTKAQIINRIKKRIETGLLSARVVDHQYIERK